MDLKTLVGQRIQEYRKLRGITQEKLAEIVGIDTVSMSKIETGRNYPTSENITKIADVLGVEVYEFFISDKIATNEELKAEIQKGLDNISNDNNKLLVIAAAMRSIAK